MSQTVINGSLTVELPANFRVMDAEELENLFRNTESNRWCATNEDKTILLTVVWQQMNRVVLMMADMKAMAVRNEMKTREAYRDHGYEREEMLSVASGKGKLEGYRYAFDSKKGRMKVETMLLKQKSFVYSLSIATSKDNTEAGRELFHSILEEL